MENKETRLAYLGKYVDEMTREELIYAYTTLFYEYQGVCEELEAAIGRHMQCMDDCVKLKYGETKDTGVTT